MSHKLFLQWSDFKDDLAGAFGILREDNDFADVTLACEGGRQFEVHKVVLASSSAFFQNILRKNKHAHPLIYMRGLNPDDLAAILDFLYFGTTSVFRENLDSFLSIAEELQLKGLTRNDNQAKKNTNDQARHEGEPRKNPVKERTESIIHKSEPPPLVDHQTTVGEYDSMSVGNWAQGRHFSGDFMDDDNESYPPLMVKTANKTALGKILYKCTLCGKEALHTDLKNHIEANHLEGISMPCKQCEKTFRTRAALRKHKSRNHQ